MDGRHFKRGSTHWAASSMSSSATYSIATIAPRRAGHFPCARSSITPGNTFLLSIIIRATSGAFPSFKIPSRAEALNPDGSRFEIISTISASGVSPVHLTFSLKRRVGADMILSDLARSGNRVPSVTVRSTNLFANVRGIICRAMTGQ